MTGVTWYLVCPSEIIQLPLFDVCFGYVVKQKPFIAPPKWDLFFVLQHSMSASKVSSANLERSYRRAPKGAGDQGVLEVAGAGVCHLCTCGQGVDWENMSLCLIWGTYTFLFYSVFVMQV